MVQMYNVLISGINIVAISKLGEALINGVEPVSVSL